jgi:hypothetical protein
MPRKGIGGEEDCGPDRVLSFSQRKRTVREETDPTVDPVLLLDDHNEPQPDRRVFLWLALKRTREDR